MDDISCISDQFNGITKGSEICRQD